MDQKIKDHLKYLLLQIEMECNSPTGEERLKNVDKLVKSAIKHLENG